MKKNPAAVALGRLGGLKKSAAKTKAVRENGRRGAETRWSTKKSLTDKMPKR